MKKIYPFLKTTIVLLLLTAQSRAQNCGSLSADCIPYESFCAATGSIKVHVTGGSGSYIYRAEGPVTTNFTSTDSITGLASGIYTVTINDLNTLCSVTKTNVVVPGNYNDPRFTLNTVDVSCDNGNNGSISVASQEFGRAPFLYTIAAPSTFGVGTTSATGQFNNLPAGNYSIRLTDSCGGIQTRLAVVNNYRWWIDLYLFNKYSCDSAKGFIRIRDSKGQNSQVAPMPGFRYGIVRAAGDTLWSNSAGFSFNAFGIRNFTVVVKDKCGIIKSGSGSLSFSPSVSNNVDLSNFTCSTFTAAVRDMRNFFGARYCLYDAADVQLSCNTTGSFTNLPYGNYCIRAYDSCTDTTLVRCFNALPPAIRIDDLVGISNKTCATFSAAIRGAVGLTNPQYCLVDSAGNRIGCNGTGVFDNLNYGSYCIDVLDGCRDTTIRRCFQASKPRPSLSGSISASYTTCTNFGLGVVGDSLFKPRFCIVNPATGQEICNNTGIFDSLAYGDYCLNVYDSCYDTTITRCFSIISPVASNDLGTAVSNQTCSTFTVKINTIRLYSPSFCVYNTADSLIACNTTGIFDNLPNGRYCIKTRALCPDSTYVNCFEVSAPRPSIDNTVKISNRSCNTFAVSASGFSNLTNPVFCLLDNNNTELSCNSSGVFNNINYGSYCMRLRDGCVDTTITRCFSANPFPVSVSVSSRKSCTLGFAELQVSAGGGILPMTVSVYNSADSMVASASYNGTNLLFGNLSGTNGAERYKVVVRDICNNKDSAFATAVPSSFVHVAGVTLNCPSSNWQNGSGSIKARVTTNMGNLTVRIIKKNGVTYNPTLTPSQVSGNIYSFNNLGPGTYVLRYRVNNNCGSTLYDTVTINPYRYPALDRSSAYQCDSSGFNVSAVVSSGVPPFTYEIIGSTPSAPSIVRAPQTSPLFYINNGSNYTLVRLRVLDACGNASLKDASILPLADNGIMASYNCFQLGTTLRIDSFYNSSYSWYKKTTLDAPDSIYLGSASSYSIPSLMPADTGWYIAHVVVNNGCITRRYLYNLNGSCSNYLPVVLNSFSGKYNGTYVGLYWKMSSDEGLRNIIIERQDANQSFDAIGSVRPSTTSAILQSYNFTDRLPLHGQNHYRLKFVYSNGSVGYSDVITVSEKRTVSGIRVYPNPANRFVQVEFSGSPAHLYRIKIMHMSGQMLRETTFTPRQGLDRIQVDRTPQMPDGLYMVTVQDAETGETTTEKVIFTRQAP